MNVKKIAILALVFFTIACSKEKKSECPETLSELIIGSFTIETPDGEGIVTFNNDGTWLDPDNTLLSVKVNGVWITDKRYEVLSESEIEVSVTDGTNVRSAIYEIPQKSCTEIVLRYEGLEVTMTRL